MPSEKTSVLKDFFGSTGDIDDPWPDGEDEQTSMRYLRCAEEIFALIELNMPRLLEFLKAKSDTLPPDKVEGETLHPLSSRDHAG